MMHRLLDRQLQKATDKTGSLDLNVLLDLVSLAYSEYELDSRRLDRATQLMTDELEMANEKLRQSLRDLRENGLRFQATIETLPHGICLYDKDGRILEYNRAYLSFFEIKGFGDARGLTLVQTLEAAGQRVSASHDRLMLILEYLAIPQTGHNEAEHIWPSGRTVRVSRTGVEGGGYLDVIADITESHLARATIERMANFDSLTGLANRNLFKKRLADLVVRASTKSMAAILCLDLDRFKAVNDLYGHATGDALLAKVARRLVDVLRPGDLAARLGGDEFAVLMEKINLHQDAHRVAKRLVSHLSAPYELDGLEITIGASVGIEFIDNPDAAPIDLMRHADQALYAAKKGGRNDIAVYDAQLHERYLHRQKIEADLRKATAGREFFLVYQPIYCVKSGRVCGYEALLRWQSPARGIVSPADFIPVAEETGIIEEIGAWVIHKACKDSVSLPEDTTIAVNVSPVQFRSRSLVSVVSRALQESGLNPRRLEIEITEGVMIGDTGQALEVLRALKALGVRISLDDFGTGYSSFNYIRAFPFDKIKIDQSFVRDLGQRSECLAIIRAVSGMCSSLGIVSTAEGVETEQQFEILKTEHCDTMQGYLFGRPAALTELNAFETKTVPAKVA
ncbi:EAL domain-containing protein [Asticcacaulis sp. DXS10W]|uniref:EAL domain-containing protein n=1 Tax=Asticcacaulis currens TaxID=2984210 RepID=A0ABT5I9M9_9CAUL|nr:EAL domain-containing protein [Asticcacaulis currens]MDC7692884.1 EAL domain-containing protein [Asticcacaulis currens]